MHLDECERNKESLPGYGVVSFCLPLRFIGMIIRLVRYCYSKDIIFNLCHLQFVRKNCFFGRFFLGVFLFVCHNFILGVGSYFPNKSSSQVRCITSSSVNDV